MKHSYIRAINWKRVLALFIAGILLFGAFT